MNKHNSTSLKDLKEKEKKKKVDNTKMQHMLVNGGGEVEHPNYSRYALLRFTTCTVLRSGN